MDDETLDHEEMLDTSENFESAYREHSNAIYKFIFWRTRNQQLSEDLTSTTFQKAWTARQSFKGGSVKAWLYRIARNTLFDYWRRNREIPSDTLSELVVDETRNVSDEIDMQMDLKQMRRAVDRLPADMQDIVRLRFIDGLPSKQVAKRLNMSDGNVRIIQYRALKKLREYLR